LFTVRVGSRFTDAVRVVDAFGYTQQLREDPPPLRRAVVTGMFAPSLR
jgi:hypothetical protein